MRLLGRFWKFLVWAISSLLVFMSQIGPDDALSNLSQWYTRGTHLTAPTWLQNPSVDFWTTIIFSAIAALSFMWFLWPIRNKALNILWISGWIQKKTAKQAPKQSAMAATARVTTSETAKYFAAPVRLGTGGLFIGAEDTVPGIECPFCSLRSFYCISTKPDSDTLYLTGAATYQLGISDSENVEIWHCVSCSRRQERKEIKNY